MPKLYVAYHKVLILNFAPQRAREVRKYAPVAPFEKI